MQPNIVFGWGDSKPRSDSGPLNAGLTWLLIAIHDGTWQFNQQVNAGPGSCLLLNRELRPKWQRAGPCYESVIGFKAWRQPNDEGVGEIDTAPDWWDASGKLNHYAAQLVIDRMPVLQSLWWSGAWPLRRANALLALLLCELQNLSHKEPEPWDTQTRDGIDARVIQAEDLARSRLNSWRTEDMARAAGMSRSAFSRLYHDQRGRAPGAFLTEARLHYADAALLHETPNIEFIANSIGFRNSSDFARWFRKHRGCSPSVFHRRSTGLR